jgi:hypothetical protein
MMLALVIIAAGMLIVLFMRSSTSGVKFEQTIDNLLSKDNRLAYPVNNDEAQVEVVNIDTNPDVEQPEQESQEPQQEEQEEPQEPQAPKVIKQQKGVYYLAVIEVNSAKDAVDYCATLRRLGHPNAGVIHTLQGTYVVSIAEGASKAELDAAKQSYKYGKTWVLQ